MLIFWVMCALLALGATAIIAAPLIRSRDGDGEAAPYRRSRVGRLAAIGAIGVGPLAALFIYLGIGEPEALRRPADARAGAASAPAGDPASAIAAMPEEERRAMIEAMVSGLAARLVAEPDDPDGWRMLARSYLVLGRADESAAAWREALKRSEGSLEDWRQFAEALTANGPGADGAVSQELEAALVNVRKFDADDPLALFILGQAAMKRGDRETALALWTRLRELIPADAPIAQTLNRMIESAE